MKNIIYFLITLLIFSASFANAQAYLDVRNYNNTYEINVHKKGQNTEAKCQATRLNRDWFLTAAHCVKPLCDDECVVSAKLLTLPKYRLDIQTSHNNSSPTVLVHERTAINKNEAGYDMALINFKPASSEYSYKDLENGYLIRKDEFLEKIPYNQKEYKEALEGTNFPTLLILKAETPKMLNRAIAVASVWDTQREIKGSYGSVFFSPKQHYIYTPNFGIRQGISGSGVFTNTGELVGVVSSTADLVREISDTTGQQRQQAAFSFFSSFDEYSLNFIRRNAGNVQYVNSNMEYLKVVPAEYRDMANAIDNTI